MSDNTKKKIEEAVCESVELLKGLRASVLADVSAGLGRLTKLVDELAKKDK